MINKDKILRALKEDLKSADLLRIETVGKIAKWRAAYDGDPYGNEQKGKSAIVSRDIKRQDEWQHASIKDPFVSGDDIVKCTPITAEDRPAAEQSELLLNYQFTRKFNRYNFMTTATRLLTTEGTCVVKTSWDYEDEKVDVQYPKLAIDPVTGQPIQIGVETVQEIKVVKNQPSAEICRMEDIYIDPTSLGDIDNAQFVIHRYESDLTSLKLSGNYKNLDKVSKGMVGNDAYKEDFIEEDKTRFMFQDEPRKKLLVHEYWGNFDVTGDGIAKPIVCTWVEGIIIRLESNPYPDKKIPFLIVSNNMTPFKLYGEANAEIIGDNQKITTAIKRGLIDNMANSNNGQKGIRKGALDVKNRNRFLNNKHFEYNGSREDFFEGNYNNIPPSAFSVLELVNSESESITGVKGFAGGISGKGLGSTATSARGALDAVSVRRLDIVRNIAENLVKPLMRKWMSYNSEFLSEEEVVRVTNEQFVSIRKDDLKGDIDIAIEVSTAEDNSSKAQELSFLLQTLGQGMDLGMKNLLMSQIAKLNKMPDLAKQLKEYQPQPDPMQQEMQQLEMAKLKSEIAERDSRAEENRIDMRLKLAKAITEETKTKMMQADTDLKDLQFTKEANGTAFQEDMQKKNHDAMTQVNLKRMDNLHKAK